MDTDTPKIDEGLYSRQLYVIDHESMQKVMGSRVLIIGLQGLGAEIAKNIVLTGVKAVTLFDNELVQMSDLGSQFFFSVDSVGQPRSAATINQLQELNHYVSVDLYNGDLTDDFLASFKVVVVTGQPLDQMKRINQVCRRNNVAFIAVDIFGPSAVIFNDFGDKFHVKEVNDQPPLSFLISAIEKGNPTTISLTEEQKLCGGISVTFSQVEGLEEFNALPPTTITQTGDYTFTIDVDSSQSLGHYEKGGMAKEYIPPVDIDFREYKQAFKQPTFIATTWDDSRTKQLHLAFHAIHSFFEKHQRMPGLHSGEDAAAIVEIAKKKNNSLKIVEEVDSTLLTILSYTAKAQISPAAAVIGGVVGQEIVKACTGKFTPIHQFCYFDFTDTLPSDYLSISAEQFHSVKDSRYHDYIAVYGQPLVNQIHNLKYFLVGAGAIGCETLKNWAMLGMSSGPRGKIYVTDMDQIEKSNLSRQFLFRMEDVSKLKSERASHAVQKMNPEVKITAYSLRVGPETENFFNDDFFEELDGVCNALDNVEARIYVDERCISYLKPLLESGTLGTRGNTQTIIPFMTESYSSSSDPAEKSIPICTLHHYPYRIEHTIQWAREQFEGYFHQAPECVNSFISQANFIDTLSKKIPNISVRLETVRSIHECLVSDRAQSFQDCVIWARLKFQDLFVNKIKQLLHTFPPDMLNSTGTLFWSAPKRVPHVAEFNANDPEHLSFIIAAANLRAFVFGISANRDSEEIKKIASSVMCEPFSPKVVFIPQNDSQTMSLSSSSSSSSSTSGDEDENCLRKMISELPSPQSLQGYRMSPAEFEKDDDANFHIDFIAACSNVRASEYTIEMCDKHKTKGIAGKIIPALITTTAMVSGLVALELIKVIQKKPIESYKSSFINLSNPQFDFFEPKAPPSIKANASWSWNLWDRIEIDRQMTLKELLDHFEEKFKLKINMLSSGMSLLHSSFGKPNTAKLSKELGELYEEISKVKLDPRTKYLSFSPLCIDPETFDEVEVPWIRYKRF